MLFARLCNVDSSYFPNEEGSEVVVRMGAIVLEERWA